MKKSPEKKFLKDLGGVFIIAIILIGIGALLFFNLTFKTKTPHRGIGGSFLNAIDSVSSFFEILFMIGGIALVGVLIASIIMACSKK
ncbi:MAG: hypothetical protein ACRBFS_24250 [Aureispira sp.]